MVDSLHYPRVSGTTGTSLVHEPTWGPRRANPASRYADGVYDAEPTELAWRILQRHDRLTLNDKTFGTWLDDVYSSDWGKKWRTDVERSYRAFERDFLRFTLPFDGTEAIRADDAQDYRDLLDEHSGPAGRLLAAGLLIPVPPYGARLGRYDRDLGVTVIDCDYDPVMGLGQIRGRGGDSYRLGEIL